MSRYIIVFLIMFSGVLNSQNKYPEELAKPYAIKWMQDNKENVRSIDLNNINIFVFTSTSEDPSDEKSDLYSFFNDLDLLFDPKSKTRSRNSNIIAGEYKDYVAKTNIYLVYNGNDYSVYTKKCRKYLSKLPIYKYCTNIVYLDDYKTSSFKDFDISNIKTCTAVIYNDQGKLFGNWNRADSAYLRFNKIYQKKDIQKAVIAGKLYSYENGVKTPLKNTNVNLVKGQTTNIIKKISTDENGYFKVELPDASKDYSLSVLANSDKTKNVILTNSSDIQVKNIAKSNQGFIYKIIDSEIATLTPLDDDYIELSAQLKLKGKLLTDKQNIRSPLQNASVTAVSNSGNKVLERAITDKYGDFTLNVPSDENSYNLVFEPESQNVDNIILADQRGAILKKFGRTGDKFKYKLINSEEIALTEVPEEDISQSFNKLVTTKNTDLEIVRSINYGLNESKFKSDAEPILNQVVAILKDNPQIKLEIISHTDSQGDDNSNLTLSKNRSLSVTNYLISNGIDARRLKAIGKGESEIRNRCLNGVDCSDKEHEYNRRTEFHFIKTE